MLKSIKIILIGIITLSAVPAAHAYIGNGCDGNPSGYCSPGFRQTPNPSPAGGDSTSSLQQAPNPAPTQTDPYEVCYQGRYCYDPRVPAPDPAAGVEDDVVLVFRPETTGKQIASALTQLKALTGKVHGLSSVKITIDSTPAYNGGEGGELALSFDSEDALDTFLASPLAETLRKNLIPIMDPGYAGLFLQ